MTTNDMKRLAPMPIQFQPTNQPTRPIVFHHDISGPYSTLSRFSYQNYQMLNLDFMLLVI